MRKLLLKLWREESAVASPEWAFLMTILVLGAITGLVASRQANLASFEEAVVVQSK